MAARELQLIEQYIGRKCYKHTIETHIILYCIIMQILASGILFNQTKIPITTKNII